MSSSDVEKSIRKLMREECRYTREAYLFVADAVTYTASNLDVHRHLSALELLEGAKKFGKSKFGCLSDMVLNSWGLVSGKTQTIYPWARLVGHVPEGIPFHDIFNQDGTLLIPEEQTVFDAVTEGTDE